MPAARPTGQAAVPRLLERLRADNRITAAQFESTLNFLQRNNEPVLDALIESGAMSEADALKALAALYRTRFVSTEKLADALIPPQVLQLVPRKVAEMHLVFPVIYDNKTASLVIVAPDPENVRVIEEVKQISRVREVKAYVGRSRSLKAAVDKFYGGVQNAFQILNSQTGNVSDFRQGIPIDVPAPAGEQDIYDRTSAPKRQQATAPAPLTANEFIIDAPSSQRPQPLP
ncbi:MAG: hypothetical protein ACHREM_28610, partial [Polyangiales bacterium]